MSNLYYLMPSFAYACMGKVKIYNRTKECYNMLREEKGPLAYIYVTSFKRLSMVMDGR